MARVLALAVDQAADRIAHPDPAADQSGQADQRQELGESFDIARKLRRGLGAATDFKAGIGKCGDKIFFDRHNIGIARFFWREQQAQGQARHGARHDQPGRLQRGVADDHPRTEADESDRIRLARQPTLQDETGRADLDRIADLHVQPRAERPVGEKSEGAVFFRELGEKALSGRQRRFGPDGAGQGIGRIDRLHLDQGGGERVVRAMLAPGHGAQENDLADLAVLVEKSPLLLAWRAKGAAEGEIAAEQDRALLGQPVTKGARRRIHPDNGHDAKDQSGDEHAVKTQRPAQVAQRETRQGPLRGNGPWRNGARQVRRRHVHDPPRQQPGRFRSARCASGRCDGSGAPAPRRG